MHGRYYALKVVLVCLAVATVAVTSGMGSTQLAHEINHARYSAPARIQATAWHTAAYLAHAIAGIFGVACCGKA